MYIFINKVLIILYQPCRGTQPYFREIFIISAKNFGGKNFGEISTISVINFGGIRKMVFPCSVLFYRQPRSKFYGTVDGPTYYDSTISNWMLEVLINANFKICSSNGR